jgi:hypothetical protein
MRNFAILVSILVLAATSSNCSSTANAANGIAPSAMTAYSAEGPITLETSAAGGQGKGRNAGAVGTTSADLALEIVIDANSDEQPSWGDTIRFNVTNPPDYPNVEVLCSQDDVVVYSAQTGYYSNTWPLTADMILASRAWTGGTASCTARLYVFNGSKTTTLATHDFTATGA